MTHVRARVIERVEQPGSISLTEYRNMGINAYEQRLMRGKLDDRSLLELARTSQQHSIHHKPLPEHRLAESHDEVLTREIYPMILDRFAARLEQKPVTGLQLWAAVEQGVEARPEQAEQRFRDCGLNDSCRAYWERVAEMVNRMAGLAGDENAAADEEAPAPR